MKWAAALLGQPPSLNDLYTIGWRTANNGRRYKGIRKRPEIEPYEASVVYQLRAQKPSRWRPPADGFLRLRWWLFLAADIDADNVLKVLSDAVQAALGMNDRNFLHSIEWKWTGLPINEARLIVEIDDDPFTSPLPVLAGSKAAPVRS